MKCPRDLRPLDRVSADHATTFDCGTCGGRAITVALLGRMMPSERLLELWKFVRTGVAAYTPCPSCTKPMRLVVFRAEAVAVQLDGCVACQLIWFDAGELRAVAPDAESPAPLVAAPVPPDASDDWVWATFFRRINARRKYGPYGWPLVDDDPG